MILVPNDKWMHRKVVLVINVLTFLKKKEKIRGKRCLQRRCWYQDVNVKILKWSLKCVP